MQQGRLGNGRTELELVVAPLQPPTNLVVPTPGHRALEPLLQVYMTIVTSVQYVPVSMLCCKLQRPPPASQLLVDDVVAAMLSMLVAQELVFTIPSCTMEIRRLAGAALSLDQLYELRQASFQNLLLLSLSLSPTTASKRPSSHIIMMMNVIIMPLVSTQPFYLLKGPVGLVTLTTTSRSIYYLKTNPTNLLVLNIDLIKEITSSNFS